MTREAIDWAARAKAAWGAAPPAEILALAEEMNRTSQGEAARRLGYSASAVSGLIKKSYLGRRDRVLARIRDVLMGTIADCPVLGRIPMERCLFEQGRAFENCVNHQHVRLFKSCRRCPNYKGGKR